MQQARAVVCSTVYVSLIVLGKLRLLGLYSCLPLYTCTTRCRALHGAALQD
jgi:hypothetical protein